MRARFLQAVAVGAVAVGVAAVPVGPVEAATGYFYYGYAAGSMIRAADSTVTSDLSAESTLLTTQMGMKDSNSLASENAQGVLQFGAVTTSVRTTTVTGGQQISATAHVADVNLLNGLVTADAITTTTTSRRVNGIFKNATHSTFANLHILGVTLPQDIPSNYTVQIGSTANVSINSGLTAVASGSSAAVGAGLRVTLLKPEGQADTGAEIDVAPTFTQIAPSRAPTTGHSTTGLAYATRITQAAGSTISVRSDPTVPTTVYAQGTQGKTLTNSLAGVNFGPDGQLGAVRTTGAATNTTTVATVTMTASAADINLLGGLIKATSVKVTAHADLSKRTAAMTLSNLTVGNAKVPLSVKPNTVIDLGTCRVTVNQQVTTAHSIRVRALDIVLLKPMGGLPVGTDIQIASVQAAAS